MYGSFLRVVRCENPLNVLKRAKKGQEKAKNGVSFQVWTKMLWRMAFKYQNNEVEKFLQDIIIITQWNP